MTTVSMTWLDGHSRSRHPDRRDVIGDGRAPYGLCSALAAIAALAAGFTVAFPLVVAAPGLSTVARTVAEGIPAAAFIGMGSALLRGSACVRG